MCPVREGSEGDRMDTLTRQQQDEVDRAVEAIEHALDRRLGPIERVDIEHALEDLGRNWAQPEGHFW